MWQFMGHVPVTRKGSDQARLNSILVTLEFTWTPVKFEETEYLKGTSVNNNLTVIALPESIVCRDKCEHNKISSYHVCHPHSHRNSKQRSVTFSQIGLWMINDDWDKNLKTKQSTSEWLQETIA